MLPVPPDFSRRSDVLLGRATDVAGELAARATFSREAPLAGERLIDAATKGTYQQVEAILASRSFRYNPPDVALGFIGQAAVAAISHDRDITLGLLLVEMRRLNLQINPFAERLPGGCLPTEQAAKAAAPKCAAYLTEQQSPLSANALIYLFPAAPPKARAADLDERRRAVAEIYLRAGVDPFARDVNGLTPAKAAHKYMRNFPSDAAAQAVVAAARERRYGMLRSLLRLPFARSPTPV